MRVLQVLDFAPPHAGGLVTHLAHLARALAGAGDALHCAFPAHRSWFAALAPQAGLHVVPQIRHPLRRGFRRRLIALQRGERFDLVHLHFSFALPLSLALGGRRGLPPLIYHWHNPPRALLPGPPRGGLDAGLLSRTLGRRLGGGVARYADRRLGLRHVVVSPHIAELLVRHGWVPTDRIACIPNAVEPCANADAGAAGTPGSGRAGAGPIVIGSIMSFRPQKDHATLLRAFSGLSRQLPHCRLVLVGEGPGRRAAERLASELGVRDRIEFTGGLGDVRPVLARIDILAHAAHYEGQCLAILEGMSCALPVVATEVGGISDMVTDGREALLVAPRDPQGLARALGRLATDEALRGRLGAAGRARVEEAYAMERWVERVRALYAVGCGTRNGRGGS